MLISTLSARRLALLAAIFFVAGFLTIRTISSARHNNGWSVYTPHHNDGTVNERPVWDPELGKVPSPGQKIEHGGSPRPAASTTPSTAGSANPALTIATSIPHLSYDSIKEKVQQLIRWSPLNTPNHWPSWSDYENQDYDPNRWEAFDWYASTAMMYIAMTDGLRETGYFTENGINRLEQQGIAEPEPYLPYPDYNSKAWSGKWKGKYVTCEGARGKNLNESLDDLVLAYPGLPKGFPNATINSADVLGLDENVCFDRYHRYGPYGYAQSGLISAPGWRKPVDRPDWSSMRWGSLQDACLQRNQDRYAPEARASMNLVPSTIMPEEALPPKDSSTQHPGPQYHSRTAVLIRTWEGYEYSENDVVAIRALVTELSLLTGGEYQVYLFVNIKDSNADIYGDSQVYQDLLKTNVPRELRDISILWSERVCEQWYPRVGDWQVYWHQFMPLQWFSKTHPEFDFVWNWETDARYTGNPYHFLEKVSDFARKMPRKYMWERNSRFYFPSAHGNYASYLADTDAAIANATAAGTLTPVWGPQPYNDSQHPTGPQPPHAQAADAFTWGAGEEADLITLQPIWDPTHTPWSYRDKIWNFVPGVAPLFTPDDPTADSYTHPAFARIPRRTFINTVARFSAPLLAAMHAENAAGRSMQAEMWPATVALQHGLKAVYAPHPVWTDRRWPAWYLDAVFNAEGGEQGGGAAWGQRGDSAYGHEREAQFRGWSWYYASFFPRVLYRRWLGWSALDVLGDVGGEAYEEHEVVGAGGEVVGGSGRGRMCLPGMLLHPVKKVRRDDGVVLPDVVRASEEDRETERRVTKEVERLLGLASD